MRLDLALQWTLRPSPLVKAFVNGAEMCDGGTLVTGLRCALADCLRAYAIEAGLLSGESGALGDQGAWRGLIAVISLWHTNPLFATSRTKLCSPEATPFVESVVKRRLFAWLRENPEPARAILVRATG